MNRLALLCLGLLSSVACAIARPPLRIQPGAPVYAPGAPEAYWVWHDAAGWHLRTTTAGQPHRFQGVVLPFGGEILEVRPLRAESRERIRTGAGGITFDLVTEGGEDGFDWRVSSGCNRFELYVDGAPRPGLVHVGAAAHHPRHVLFDRCG